MTAWPGDAPLAKPQREPVRAALMLLGLCPFWLGERHWHGLREIWTKRAARLDSWLRQSWLETLGQWLCFLDDIGLAADSLPDCPPPVPAHHLPLHARPPAVRIRASDDGLIDELPTATNASIRRAQVAGD